MPASSYHNFISGRYKDNSIWSTYFPQSTEKYYKAKPSWKFPDSGENDDSSSNEIPSYRPSTVNKLPTTTITTTTSASRKSNEIIFSYDDNDPYGPDNWDKIDPVCDGNSQSPVNIYTALSIPAVRSYPLVIDGFFSLPSNVTISNSGHSAVLKFQYPNGRPVRVYGGPLEVPYFLDNIHFHWGKRDTAGSEHALNARHYSAEMHLVLYNSNYGKNPINFPFFMRFIFVDFRISHTSHEQHKRHRSARIFLRGSKINFIPVKLVTSFFIFTFPARQHR